MPGNTANIARLTRSRPRVPSPTTCLYKVTSHAGKDSRLQVVVLCLFLLKVRLIRIWSNRGMSNKVVTVIFIDSDDSSDEEEEMMRSSGGVPEGAIPETEAEVVSQTFEEEVAADDSKATERGANQFPSKKTAFESVLVQSSRDENWIQRLPSGRKKKRIARKALLDDKCQEEEVLLTGGFPPTVSSTVSTRNPIRSVSKRKSVATSLRKRSSSPNQKSTPSLTPPVKPKKAVKKTTLAKAKKKTVKRQTKASTDKSASNPVYVGEPTKFLREEGWPEGWVERQYKRQSGMTKNRVDFYWFAPTTDGRERKFRSIVEVKRYVGVLAATGSEDKAFAARKG